MTERTPQLTPATLRELRLRDEFHLGLQRDPELFFPFLRPCDNRVLLVTDEGLDFSERNFGLSVFVRTLLDTPGRHVRHRITLAHIDPVDPSRLLPLEGRVVRRIPDFKFDDPNHFTPDAYDVVMLFGSASRYARGDGYPADRLSDAEIAALTAFMNGGGGLFATGDHGKLGYALSNAVPRVRNMRLWDSTAAQIEADQVSMDGANRNDTNRGTLFDNQSDDVPQVIEPKLFTGGWIFQVRFPHPLLCGPNGVIRVMPDHPHEGQCVEPADTTLVLGGDGGPEYPAAVGAGPRPVPEVISTSRVPVGNTAAPADKTPTVAQSFGGIAAYDGHRAGIGRVVTDATWHHFVNVNLKGIADQTAPAPFDKGFLTVAGQGVLEEIRAYYRNIVVWTSRSDRIRCMNTRLAWDVLFSDRVLEAVLTATSVRLGETTPVVLRLIGQHARDALGRVAGQCQSFSLVLDLALERAIPQLVPEIDPWLPGERERQAERVWFDGSPIVDVALGAALVALREAFGEPTPETVADLDTDRLAGVLAEGGSVGARMALESMAAEIGTIRERLGI